MAKPVGRLTLFFSTAAAACLGIYYGFSKIVRLGYFKQIDFDITVRLQDHIPTRLDPYWEDIGFFAGPAASIALVIFLTGLSMVVFKPVIKKLAAVIILPAFAGMIGAEVIGKSLVEQTAPPFFLLKNPTAHFPTYHVFDVNSYPSGHAGRSLFIALVAWLIVHTTTKHKALRAGTTALLFGYVVAVALGKVYLGQHWFTDIVGGWITAVAAIFVVYGVIEAAGRVRLPKKTSLGATDPQRV